MLEPETQARTHSGAAVKDSLARPSGVGHHVLSNGRGRFTWLLCRETARLERLKGASA